MSHLDQCKLEAQRIKVRLEHLLSAAATIDPDDPDVAALATELKSIRKQADHIYRTDWSLR